MSPDQPTRQAVRHSQRKGRKAGISLTKEEIVRAHNRVEPWKRVVFVSLGIFVGAFAYGVHLLGGPIWVVLIVGALAFMTIGFGLLGKKRQFDEAFKGSLDNPLIILLDGLF